MRRGRMRPVVVGRGRIIYFVFAPFHLVALFYYKHSEVQRGVGGGSELPPYPLPRPVRPQLSPDGAAPSSPRRVHDPVDGGERLSPAPGRTPAARRRAGAPPPG